MGGASSQQSLASFQKNLQLATSSSKSPVSTCLTERPSSRMPTCLRRCSKTLWTVPRRRSRNTTSRRTSPPTSRRSLTKSTTRPGTALWGGTSAPTSPTRPGISSTSTWVKSPYCCSRAAKSSVFSSPCGEQTTMDDECDLDALVDILNEDDDMGN